MAEDAERATHQCERSRAARVQGEQPDEAADHARIGEQEEEFEPAVEDPGIGEEDGEQPVEDLDAAAHEADQACAIGEVSMLHAVPPLVLQCRVACRDRKSTRLNSSHANISY